MSDLFPPGAVSLGNGVVLRPMSGVAAAALGPPLAMIDPYARLGYGGQALGGYLSRPDAALHRFQIEMGDVLAGALAVRHPWLRGPFVEMLGILPAFQGHGLGRSVISWLLTQTRPHSANLWASVSDFNQAGRAFWARLGFAEVCPLAGLVDVDGAEILLRNRLC